MSGGHGVDDDDDDDVANTMLKGLPDRKLESLPKSNQRGI